MEENNWVFLNKKTKGRQDIVKTLDTKAKRNYYIGVLDIAGFEIFVVGILYKLTVL
jgi:hypothetical protein